LAVSEHKDIFRQDTTPAVKVQEEIPEPAVEEISVRDVSPTIPVPTVQVKSEAPAEVKSYEIPTPAAEVFYKKSEILRENEPKFTDTSERCDLNEYRKVIKTPLAQELSDTENLRYAGILFGTFIILESLTSEAMYLIDFHAAHERVLYEELLEKAQSDQPVPSQQLLLPPAIELSRTAAAFINKNEKLFTKLGFDAALLSSNTVLLNAVPANLSGDADWEKVLTDLVATALDGEKNTRDSLETIARAACHSAVKAHDPLNEITAQALIKSLSKCQRPDVCPHGRPTVLKMTLNELSRRFGRI
jgi:DNA mismatch repair protein MutL